MILRYLHFWTPFILAVYCTHFGPLSCRVIDKPEEAMPANAFATGGEVEHEVRSTFRLFEGFLSEASAGHYDWRDTLFRYRGEVGQAIQ